MGSRGSSDCPWSRIKFCIVYWLGRVVRKEFTVFRFSKEFVNKNMAKELWYRACILKGGRQYFPPKRQKLVPRGFLCIKYIYTYSAYRCTIYLWY